jgi:hypothetical protein
MPETMPIADAMEQAQAELTGETEADRWAESNRLADETAYESRERGDADATAAEPAAPVQVPLFEPPPFDFEQAYDELHRLDQRARLRKSAWEIAKSDASDCKKSYDTAIEDLHKKFAEIERARSEALKPRLTTESTPTTPKGGDAQMGEPEEVTEIDTPETEGEPPASETSTDAPSD